MVTIARVRWTEEHEPAAEVVYQEAWTGAAMTTAHHALAQLLGETFPCTRIAVDATGIAAGPAAWLAERLGKSRVEAFVFTAPGKARLSFMLPAMAGTGRVRLYRPADEEARRHRGRMDREIERARYELRGTEQPAFFVPAREEHDDYLMSLALCAWTAASPPPPLSETIPPAIDRHGRVQAEQYDGEEVY